MYVSSNDEKSASTTNTNKITSQEKYVLYLREQLRHKQMEQWKDHEQKQQNLQQMQNQMYYTTPTYQTSTQSTLHYHSPAPSKEYLKTSKPIILQNIQEKPQNHYYHEQHQPQSQHLNGQQLREKELEQHEDVDGGVKQQFYYHQHQSTDEIYQKQNTSPPQVHNNQHHHYQHHYQQQQQHQQDDDQHDYRNQPHQQHLFYHQSPNKENAPQLNQESSIETQR